MSPGWVKGLKDSSHCLPRPLTGSCIKSGAARTQISIYRWRVSLLHHHTSHMWLYIHIIISKMELHGERGREGVREIPFIGSLHR